jgi:hypothetical protein
MHASLSGHHALLLCFAGTALTSGCVTRHDHWSSVRDRWPAPLTVSFDSARVVVMQSRTTATRDTVPEALYDVLEVGGTLLNTRGDTLVVEPLYVTICERVSASESRIVRKSWRHVDAGLLRIPLGDGMHVATPPARHELTSREESVILAAVTIVSGWYFLLHDR